MHANFEKLFHKLENVKYENWKYENQNQKILIDLKTSQFYVWISISVFSFHFRFSNLIFIL